MNDESELIKYEEILVDEIKFCARIASIHTLSKDMVKASKVKLKELKDRQIEKAKKVIENK